MSVFLSTYLQSLLRVEYISSISLSFFKYLYLNSLKNHEDENTGSITQKLNHASNDVYIMINNITQVLFPGIIKLSTAIAIVLLSGDIVVGTIFFIYTVLFSIINFMFTKKLISSREVLMQSSVKTYGIMSDSIKNMEVVKVNNSFDFFFLRFKSHLKNDVDSQSHYWKIDFISVVCLGALQFVFFMSSFLFTLNQLINQEIPLSHFVLISSYLLILTAPLESLGQASVSFMQSYNSFGRFIKDFNLYENVTPAFRSDLISDTTIKVTDAFYKKISSGFTLGPVSLKFNPGSFTTIMGKSGSGKSTLLKILFRQLISLMARL